MDEIPNELPHDREQVRWLWAPVAVTLVVFIIAMLDTCNGTHRIPDVGADPPYRLYQYAALLANL